MFTYESDFTTLGRKTVCALSYWSVWPYRWTNDVCVRAFVQTSSEVVKVRLVRQREAAEVSHTGGDRHRSLALHCHQGPQLPLWTAQCHHVRHVLITSLHPCYSFESQFLPLLVPLKLTPLSVLQPYSMGRPSSHKPYRIKVSQSHTLEPLSVSYPAGDFAQLHDL